MLVSVLKKGLTSNWYSRCFFSSVSKTFEEAKLALSKLKKDPDNNVKLKIYALFKQATEGKCTKQRPGRLDFIKFAKWQAWSDLGDMTKDMASESYIKLVDQLLASEMPSASAAAVSDHAPTSEIDLHIDTNGIMRLTLNRPTKKNAITWTMYETWTSMLTKAAEDANVKMVVITGTGDYFCSGNDLSNFSEASKPGADLQKMVDAGKQVMQKFVASFIDFPKPLIGLVNGSAVGIAVTTLPLYDCVMASDAATFHVPLTALGMTPEGCASYTFPRTMGSMKASNMLLFGRKLSAFEALSAGLITDVFPSQSFDEESRARIEQMAALPTQTLLYAKALLRAPASKAAMHATNLVESDRLAERWTSPDCIKALTAFLTRRG